MRGHGLYRGKQMAHVSIERKIYMKLTFPSTRSKIGSRIIGMMAIIKRFRMLKTRLRMFRQPFLDGRRSDRADAMSVYRDKLWYLTGVYVHWKRPAICLPSHGICLYYVVVFLSSKRMKIISCCLMEVYEADNVIKVSYISAFDSQGRCFKKKRSFLTPIYIISWWWLQRNQVTTHKGWKYHFSVTLFVLFMHTKRNQVSGFLFKYKN